MTSNCPPSRQPSDRRPIPSTAVFLIVMASIGMAAGRSANGKVNRARATPARAIDAGKRPSLRDASAVNSTRWALFQAVKATGLPVATGTGGHTKWNRQRLGVPKGHALDAACVGTVEAITNGSVPVLAIKASGRGNDQRTRLTRHGFPRGYLTRQKPIRGFQTGDPVRAEMP